MPSNSWIFGNFWKMFFECQLGRFQKGNVPKKEILKIAFLRCLKTFLKRKFPFLEHFLFKTFQLALKTFFKILQKIHELLVFRSMGNKYVWVQVSFPTNPSHLWVNLCTCVEPQGVNKNPWKGDMRVRIWGEKWGEWTSLEPLDEITLNSGN